MGGQSATTDILACEDGSLVVLRRHGPWSSGFDDGIAAREAATLAAVGTAGVPTPPVLWAGRLGGRTAIVTAFVDGAAVLHPTDGATWAEHLAATLADIHSVDADPSLARLLVKAPASPVDDVSILAALDRPGTVELSRRRGDLAPTQASTLCLIHGDYWPGNVLWTDGRIVAVLDWEAARLGDPAADVAYCAMEMHLLGCDEEAETFVSSYRDRTGSKLSSLDYWMVTALCRGLADPESFIAAWRGLGHEDEVQSLIERQRRLIDQYT